MGRRPYYQIPTCECCGTDHLTERDLTVLRFLACNYPDERIAAKMGRAVSTTKNRVARLRRHFETNSRAGVVLIALKRGLITLDDVHV